MEQTLYFPYSRKEEIWNASVHFAGILLSIFFWALMIGLSVHRQSASLIVSVSIFGISMIVMYTASTLYHLAQQPKTKSRLKKFDHIAIYYLIAGSYTPFMLITLNSTMGIVMFSIVWGLAFAGTMLKIFLPCNGKKLWSILLYVVMGWLVLFASKELFSRLTTAGTVFLILGGVFYTTGILFYIQKKKPYMHAVWHFFVLAGSIMHFLAVLFACILPI